MASEGARSRQSKGGVATRLQRVQAAIGRAMGRVKTGGAAGIARMRQLARRMGGATGAAERILSRPNKKQTIVAGEYK